jgi:hypothetical protein
MKRINLLTIGVLAITLGAIATLQSCGKIAGLLNFNLNMQTESVNVTIPATGDTSGTITIGPSSSVFNVDSFIKAQTGNQLGAANITSLKLKSVVFTLNNADIATNNFRNFKSVAASFSSNTNSTPYNVSIANNPDVYSNTLNVPIDTTVDLKTYIGDQYNYFVTGKLLHGTTKPLDCTITFTFSVNVKG